MSQFKDSQAEKEREFFLTGPFCSIQAFSGLDEAQPLGEGNLLYSQPTNSDVNLIQKRPHRHIQDNVEPNIQTPHSPGKPIHRINYHSSEK